MQVTEGSVDSGCLYTVDESNNDDADTPAFPPLPTTDRTESFVSKLPRNVVPCASDRLALRLLTASVSRALQERHDGGQDIEDDSVILHLAFDANRTCATCQTVLNWDDSSPNSTALRRQVWPHTLTHGTLTIDVLGLVCPNCTTIARFDGFECALFSSSTKTTVYTRELLDYWLYKIAMLGSTVRAAYESAKNLSRTTSVVHGRLGQNLTCNRRQSSSAFSAFLQSIAYPSESEFATLFNCP